MRLNHGPSLWQAAVWLLLASGCGAVAWRVPMADWLRVMLVLAAIVFGILGVFVLIDWVAFEFGARLRQINYAQMARATAMSRALSGHDEKSREYIANQVMLEFKGYGEPLVMWYWVLPNGFKVPVELLDEWLEASKERGDGFLFPVRNHEDTRFRGFVNVEESLQRMTFEFVRRGWAERAIGNQPARMRVSFDFVEEQLNLR